MPATLERPVLPQRLYRYRALRSEQVLQREISAIKEPHLWCSLFSSMNDPMEGFCRPSRRHNNPQRFSIILSSIHEKKIQIGIVSLSDNKDNELMWAHYAGNYSGICVAYETESLIAGLDNGMRLVRLNYDDHPPRIVGWDDEAAVVVLSQKKGSWAYEREWRVLGPIVGDKTKISVNCITHIYLGSRVKDEHRNSIIAEFQSTSIEISEMQIDEKKGYQHTWEPV